MSKRSFGFLQDDFHTEVLDFLFELLQEIDCELVLYNSVDRYGNKNIYLKKYKNLKILPLADFITDLHNRVHEKMIIVSYDNVIGLDLLLNYADNLLFVAHSTKHIDYYENYNLNYFSLTHLLSQRGRFKNRYLLPLVKNSNKQFILDNFTYDQSTLSKLAEHLENNNDLIRMMMIGFFDKHNRDVEEITKLLNTGKVFLCICTADPSEFMIEYVKNYPNHIAVLFQVETADVVQYTHQLNIQHLLFIPNKSSSFYTSSWSGSVAFGLNFDYKLIVPESFRHLYKFTNTEVISLDSVEEILNFEKFNSLLNIQPYRDSVYQRNKIVFYDILDQQSINSIYGSVHGSNEAEVESDLFNIEYLKEHIQNFNKNDNIIYINGDPTICLGILQLSKCNVYNFQSDLNRAKLHKTTMIANDYLDRVKVYNNIIGEKCVSGTIDTLTIDSLNLENVKVVIVEDKDNLRNVQNGCKNHHEVLFFYKQNNDLILYKETNQKAVTS